MFKPYEVTISPKVAAHAGTWTNGESTVTVYAKDRADAIKRARSAYRGEEGRYAPACTYRAKEMAE